MFAVFAVFAVFEEETTMMAAAALVLFAVYFLAGFVLRTLIQWKWTGDSGFRGVSGRVG